MYFHRMKATTFQNEQNDWAVWCWRKLFNQLNSMRMKRFQNNFNFKIAMHWAKKGKRKLVQTWVFESSSIIVFSSNALFKIALIDFVTIYGMWNIFFFHLILGMPFCKNKSKSKHINNSNRNERCAMSFRFVHGERARFARHLNTKWFSSGYLLIHKFVVYLFNRTCFDDSMRIKTVLYPT